MVSSGGINRDALANSGSSGNGYLSNIRYRPVMLCTTLLDDWGPETLTDDQRRDLLEVTDDRHEMRSVIITSQLLIGQWYEIIGNPTIADAILDRLVHNAYRIELTGESLRKKKNPPLTNTQT
jgi:IstB-like ATP binding protein